MRTNILLAVAILMALSLAASSAEAQIRFSIGSGGVSVGNYPPGYPYGPYGYRYGPNPYYAPPPVVVNRYYQTPAVQYVQPTPAGEYAGPGVAIRNPADPNVTISYTIDSQREFEIAPGETQRLTDKGKYVVEFDRGGQFGSAKYSIREGVYQFTPTSRGWELFRQEGESPIVEPKPELKTNPLPTPAEKKAEPSLPMGQET